MSSRSNGVMKVELILLYSSWVICVAVVLDLDQPLADRLHVGAGQGQLGEQLGAAHEVLRGAAEELVEGALGGAEGKLHGANLVTDRWAYAVEGLCSLNSEGMLGNAKVA